MASPSEAAPALVKLKIVINYRGTCESGARARRHARPAPPRQR